MTPAEPRRGRGRPRTDAKHGSPLLDRTAIINFALALVDEEGLQALSMRNLAKRLGVDPMAIYYYLPDKNSIYDAIAEALMSSITLPSNFGTQPLLTDLEAAGHAYKSACLAHPAALPLLSSRPLVTAASLFFVERILARLIQEGISARVALDLINAIGNYIRGCLPMWLAHSQNSPDHQHAELDPEQLPPEHFPALHVITAEVGSNYDPERTFVWGLRALLSVLEKPESLQK